MEFVPRKRDVCLGPSMSDNDESVWPYPNAIGLSLYSRSRKHWTYTSWRGPWLVFNMTSWDKGRNESESSETWTLTLYHLGRHNGLLESAYVLWGSMWSDSLPTWYNPIGSHALRMFWLKTKRKDLRKVPAMATLVARRIMPSGNFRRATEVAIRRFTATVLIWFGLKYGYYCSINMRAVISLVTPNFTQKIHSKDFLNSFSSFWNLAIPDPRIVLVHS
jgi:hypothetical protein